MLHAFYKYAYRYFLYSNTFLYKSKVKFSFFHCWSASLLAGRKRIARRQGESEVIVSRRRTPLRRRKHWSVRSARQKKSVPGRRARNAQDPAGAWRGRIRKRASGSGRMRPAVTYLTYPLQGGITVTDSQGVSPYSVCRTGGAGWHLLTSVLC